MQQYAPKVIFTDEKMADVIMEAAKLENLDVKIIVFGKHSSLQSLNEIISFQTKTAVKKFTLTNEKSTDEASVILTTSGTTGFPKGVLFSGKSISALAKAHLTTTSNGILNILWYTDLSWISGIGLALQTIVQKNIHVITPWHADENEFLKYMEKYEVSII